MSRKPITMERVRFEIADYALRGLSIDEATEKEWTAAIDAHLAGSLSVEAVREVLNRSLNRESDSFCHKYSALVTDLYALLPKPELSPVPPLEMMKQVVMDAAMVLQTMNGDHKTAESLRRRALRIMEAAGGGNASPKPQR